MLSHAKRAFPGLFLTMRTLAGRLYDTEVERLTLERCRSRVIDGPFRGMRYIDRASCSALTPKLLGTYERELHPFIEEIIGRRHAHVIDVGSAEGYYAVGLALTMPASRIHAYDIDENALRNLAALADLNGVTDRISMSRECSFETFERFRESSFAVICDIEGAERHLLDPAAAPALTACDILVEIHDGVASTAIHDSLSNHFSNTHDLRFVRYRGRAAHDAAHAPWLGHARNRIRAVDEHRTLGVEWGYFRAKTTAVSQRSSR